MIVLSDSVHVARKQYDCDARYWWEMAGLFESDMQPGDWATAQTALSNHWRISPGDQYRRVVYVDGGALCVYRAEISIDNLCQRLGLFDE